MALSLKLPTVLQTALPSNTLSKLEAARAERDRLGARMLKGCEFLDGLAEQVGQDSPEYDRYFAEWEKVNAAYMRAADWVDCLELAAEIRRGSTS